MADEISQQLLDGQADIHGPKRLNLIDFYDQHQVNICNFDVITIR